MSKDNFGIQVIAENTEDHPCCPHGPSLLFSRLVDGKKKTFFACSACRDRKRCTFFLWQDERSKFKKHVWKEETRKFLNNLNHRKKFIILNRILQIEHEKRMYCLKCLQLYTIDEMKRHEGHNFLSNVTDYQLNNPSKMLPSLDDSKKEAQYLFCDLTVEFIVDCFMKLGYRNVICIGTPRIHEYIRNNCEQLNSILLDFDRRFHDFFGPLEYCWYNVFNHHFFLSESSSVFEDFLSANQDTVLITDPPFGGRVEPIAFTLQLINEKFKKLHDSHKDLPLFWIFPYFMEPYILNSMENFQMLDYKVDYDNHAVFQQGPKGRKHGSPVRIFTNVSPSLIELPSDLYKYCRECVRWVAQENKHCKKCNSCTSKNGVTYIHCSICKKCVKPTWQHCEICSRCALPEHKCGELEFTKECFSCKQLGHKRSQCPQMEISEKTKRKFVHNKKQDKLVYKKNKKK